MITNKKKNPLAEQSRQWLMQSLFDLMKKKTYTDITITEIAEHASISRRTFYRIFDSKDQVLKQLFLQLCDEYTACYTVGENYNYIQVIELFFGFWEKHLEFLRILQKNHLFYYLLEEFNSILPTIHYIIHGDEDLYNNVLDEQLGFLASAGLLWNILSEWIQLEERPSPKVIANALLNALAANL